ncbi:MAG: hypothetical protein IPI57_15040 [Candidatus Competibacteraceae bacterium]|nr:hypothetical protein [Candidatus Competibacteraceae bacterium]
MALDLTAQAHQPLIVSLGLGAARHDSAPLAMDASLFLLNAAGACVTITILFYNQEADPSGAIYRLTKAEGANHLPRQRWVCNRAPRRSRMRCNAWTLCLRFGHWNKRPAGRFRAGFRGAG